MNELLKELMVAAQDMENDAEDIGEIGGDSAEILLRSALRSFAGRLRQMVKQQQEQALTEMVRLNEEMSLYDKDYVTQEVVMHKCITVDMCGLPDSDIEAMSPEDLKQKLREIRDTALWWAAQQDDDRCWLDDVKVLKAILPHGCIHFEMPDDLTFIGNCLNFKKTRCPKNPKLHEW